MAGVTDRAGLLTRDRAVQELNQTSQEAKFQEENVVNKEIRWRIVSLQAMLVIILAGASGFLFYEGSFVTNMVKTELTAQQVFFPGTDQIKAGGAHPPPEVAQERQH